MAVSITIVTPWHNAHALIPKYSEALTTADFGPHDAVVTIDNRSDPAIWLPLVESHFGEWRYHRGENLGFSRACNFGVESARTDAFVFLNNDVILTHPNWLREIRDELRPGVIVGPYNPGRHTGGYGIRPLDYVDGWCLAGMRDDLLSLDEGYGVWDERYEEPSYWGDNDLCLRARRKGMKLVYLPNNFGLRHLGNHTSRRLDVSGVSERNRERYLARARELLAVA